MANHGERRPSFWDNRLAESNPFAANDNEKGKAALGEVEIAERIRQGSVPEIHGEAEALAIARKGGWEIEALMSQMEMERVAQNAKQGFFDLNFKNPKHFTWLLVGFASMGGLLSGLDQSLISGANLYMPKDLGLTVQQNSLVNSGESTLLLCSSLVESSLSFQKTISIVIALRDMAMLIRYFDRHAPRRSWRSLVAFSN